MKTTIKMLMLAATTVVTACVGAQPPPPCAVGHGGFGAKFTQTAGPASGACVRKGDIIGVQKYRQTDGTSDIYLKSVWLAEMTWGEPAVGAAGMTTGKLAANNPDADGFCTVASMPAVTADDPNGDTLTYTWTNVRFFVSGTVPGTQFTANLNINDGAGCSADYTVDAMYPVVTCEAHDADDNPLNTPNEEACGEVDHVWSGLAANPLFDTQCITTRHTTDADNWGLGEFWLCVPEQPVPSVEAGTTL